MEQEGPMLTTLLQTEMCLPRIHMGKPDPPVRLYEVIRLEEVSGVRPETVGRPV